MNERLHVTGMKNSTPEEISVPIRLFFGRKHEMSKLIQMKTRLQISAKIIRIARYSSHNLNIIISVQLH